MAGDARRSGRPLPGARHGDGHLCRSRRRDFVRRRDCRPIAVDCAAGSVRLRPALQPGARPRRYRRNHRRALADRVLHYRRNSSGCPREPAAGGDARRRRNVRHPSRGRGLAVPAIPSSARSGRLCLVGHRRAGRADGARGADAGGARGVGGAGAPPAARSRSAGGRTPRAGRRARRLPGRDGAWPATARPLRDRGAGAGRSGGAAGSSARAARCCRKRSRTPCNS